MDAQMEIDKSGNTSLAGSIQPKVKIKSHDLFNCTIRKPLHAYAHLELVSDASSLRADLDALQVRSYLSSALKQFLGLTGSGMPIDILKVEGKECWIRLSRQDLGPFAAAITAWTGASHNGVTSIIYLRASGDHLGSLIGRYDQHKIWDS